MKLIHEATGEPAKIGEMLTDRDGQQAKLLSIREPHSPASTGRVYVEWDAEDEDDRFRQEYFPSVFGLEWIEREDRTG